MTHTPTMRIKNAGANQPPVSSETVEAEAIAAAQANRPLHDACPYPLYTEAGWHFTAIWFLHTNAAQASLHARPASN